MDLALAFAAYVLLSMFTFVVYAVDKSSARNGTRRISESTLHLLSLTGGWPGALPASHSKCCAQDEEAIVPVRVLDHRHPELLCVCLAVHADRSSALRMISATVRDLVVN